MAADTRGLELQNLISVCSLEVALPKVELSNSKTLASHPSWVHKRFC